MLAPSFLGLVVKRITSNDEITGSIPVGSNLFALPRIDRQLPALARA